MGNLAYKHASLFGQGMQAAKLDLAGDSDNLASFFSSRSIHEFCLVNVYLHSHMCEHFFINSHWVITQE